MIDECSFAVYAYHDVAILKLKLTVRSVLFLCFYSLELVAFISLGNTPVAVRLQQQQR